MEIFIRVARRDPRFGECHGYIGQIYLEQEKDYTRAIEHLTRAARQCERDHKHISLYHLALAYEAAGRRSEALKTWSDYFIFCPKGTNWEREAQKHYAALSSALAPTPTP